MIQFNYAERNDIILFSRLGCNCRPWLPDSQSIVLDPELFLFPRHYSPTIQCPINLPPGFAPSGGLWIFLQPLFVTTCHFHSSVKFANVSTYTRPLLSPSTFLSFANMAMIHFPSLDHGDRQQSCCWLPMDYMVCCGFTKMCILVTRSGRKTCL